MKGANIGDGVIHAAAAPDADVVDERAVVVLDGDDDGAVAEVMATEHTRTDAPRREVKAGHHILSAGRILDERCASASSSLHSRPPAAMSSDGKDYRMKEWECLPKKEFHNGGMFEEGMSLTRSSPRRCAA